MQKTNLWLPKRTCGYQRASLIAPLVENPPAMQETLVQFLDREDPLEQGKVTHSSVLVWRIHGLYSPWGRKQSEGTERLSLSQKGNGGGINQEFEINIYTLLHIYRKPKGTCHIAGNYTQYFVITNKGRLSEKEYVFVCVYN